MLTSLKISLWFRVIEVGVHTCTSAKKFGEFWITLFRKVWSYEIRYGPDLSLKFA